MIQVSELLTLVLSELTPGRPAAAVAEAVSDAFGRTLTPDGLTHLLERRLQPLGLVVTTADGSPAEAPRANPLLSLSLRGTMVPAATVQRLARIFAPLFLTPIVVGVLCALVVLDVALVRYGDLVGAIEQVLTQPSLLLGVYAVLVLGGFVHETGHAAACWYGGGRPGRIGYGVYLVFPAFFTDVTDSYRLSRAGRIRTDLGGLYFNVWCLLAFGASYLATGSGLFLIAIVLMHLEMVEQLIPVVRFDGYFVLADLAGVPDLFSRIGPVLGSLRTGSADPRVTELRPTARRVVAAWALLVVPLLALTTGWLMWQLPFVVGRTFDSLRIQADQMRSALSRADVALLALSALDVVLLLLPLLGLAVLLARLARSVQRRLSHQSSPQEAAMSTHLPTGALTAAAFNDEEMLPGREPPPEVGWRRTVYRTSRGRLNPGPGPSERQYAAIERRLCTPIEGSRRVVVMSRKGGVGKTTITLALGSVLATVRGDRVVAVDANPDAGNLAHRVAPPSGRTITDVLADQDKIDTYADLRSYLSQAPQSRLEVLASDDDPRIGMALDRTDYHRLIGLLDRFYNLILLDTGTGILDSANQGLLTEADQLVVVLRAGIDGGRAAALTLDWLEEHEHEELVERAVVVINGVRRGAGAPLGRFTAHFEQRCARVVTVPWDPALETGGQTVLSELRRGTQHHLMVLAAAVAETFTSGAHR